VKLTTLQTLPPPKKKQRLEEEADFRAARELFGGGGGKGLDDLLPKTLKDFEGYAEQLAARWVLRGQGGRRFSRRSSGWPEQKLAREPRRTAAASMRKCPSPSPLKPPLSISNPTNHLPL
jgi:hypothetical protein